jgi:hypothetical protein
MMKRSTNSSLAAMIVVFSIQGAAIGDLYSYTFTGVIDSINRPWEVPDLSVGDGFVYEVVIDLDVAGTANSVDSGMYHFPDVEHPMVPSRPPIPGNSYSASTYDYFYASITKTLMDSGMRASVEPFYGNNVTHVEYEVIDGAWDQTEYVESGYIYASDGGYDDWVRIDSGNKHVTDWSIGDTFTALETDGDSYLPVDIGSSVTLSSIQVANPVPVPSAFLLGAIGLGVAGRKLRKQRS